MITPDTEVPPATDPLVVELLPRSHVGGEIDRVGLSRLGVPGEADRAVTHLGAPVLIVRGQGNLLDNVEATEDLDRIRKLIEDLENKRDFIHLLDLAHDADGVRIFIGSENKLFSMSGSSLILAPYMNAEQSIVGVVGVIGPTRINYARVVPMVDYTAKVIGRLLG